MPATEPALPTLADFLAAPLRVGEPDVHGALAVFPLFGPPPSVSTSRSPWASGRGLLVKELDGGTSVNDLLVLNPTDVDVLVCEGEAVLGAQQNRTFDVSVLVAAGRTVRVPVSCVEHGRWERVGAADARRVEGVRGVARGRPLTRHDAIGLGCDGRFATAVATGAGLVAGDELVQLTAFAVEHCDAARPPERRARLRRASRRR